jgi:peptidoglycan L-alanyl-D-glutamate endopeptidase CwlK
MRTFEEQAALYNQEHDGKDNDGDGIIDNKSEHVTNAKPGQSFHNYGLAIDVCPFINGKPDWKSKLWDRIGALGESIGFAWGGRWKSIKDLPHFEYPPKTSYTKLLELKNAGKVDKDGYVILT